MSSIIGYLHLRLETTEPVTIADPERQSAIHRPMTLNHKGNVDIPSTGLVGSLRDHIDDPEPYLGSDRPENDQDPMVPSRLRALGTKVHRGDQPITEDQLRTRSQTKIDTHRAAAASRMLRTSQELPAGAEIDLWCEYDGHIPEALIEDLLSWRPTIGGGRTVGMGSAQVTSVAHGSLNLENETDVATFLEHGGPDLVSAAITTTFVVVAEPGSSDEPLIQLTATIEDGLHTFGKVEPKPKEQTNVQLVLRDDTGRPIVEGSSIKGVLRSRVAEIAATVAATNGATPEAAATGGRRVADTIFGTTRQRGCLAVRRAVIDEAVCDERPHVAIDRFTGGAASGLLFKEEVVSQGSFEIRIDSIADQLPPYARPLLLAALADIDAGYCGLGAKTGRGLGTVTLAPRAEIDAALPLHAQVIEQIVDAAAEQLLPDDEEENQDV